MRYGFIRGEEYASLAEKELGSQGTPGKSPLSKVAGHVGFLEFEGSQRDIRVQSESSGFRVEGLGHFNLQKGKRDHA